MTGAGGSAPKHIQQFISEGHLRWDSLGEYLAVAVSLEHYYHVTHNQRAHTLSKTLNLAIERLLQNRKSPGRKVIRGMTVLSPYSNLPSSSSSTICYFQSYPYLIPRHIANSVL